MRKFKFKGKNRHKSKYCAYFQETLYGLLNILNLKENAVYHFEIGVITIIIDIEVIIIFNGIIYYFDNHSNYYDLLKMKDIESGYSMTNKFHLNEASYYEVFKEMENILSKIDLKNILKIKNEISW